MITNILVREHLECGFEAYRGAADREQTRHFMRQFKEDVKTLPPAFIMNWGNDMPLYVITYCNLEKNIYWRSAIYGMHPGEICGVNTMPLCDDGCIDVMVKAGWIKRDASGDTVFRDIIVERGDGDTMGHVSRRYASLFKGLCQLSPRRVGIRHIEGALRGGGAVGIFKSNGGGDTPEAKHSGGIFDEEGMEGRKK